MFFKKHNFCNFAIKNQGTVNDYGNYILVKDVKLCKLLAFSKIRWKLVTYHHIFSKIKKISNVLKNCYFFIKLGKFYGFFSKIQ